jgi:aminopeptidase-like protein
MIELLKKLYPINRSLTGKGVRETIKFIKNQIGELKIHEVPSGTQVFDRIIPDEWNVEEAYLITPDGNRICDYQRHNLHLVGYSTPVEISLSLDDL